MQAYLVIIMGTQYYEGKEHRYVDYPITDMLQMIGRAGRPGIDESAICVIFGHSRKKEFYKKFIYEPLPIESHFDHYLHDHLNAEIVTRTIENKQDAVDYITWTFYYRRLAQNPNYYNMQGVSHRHVSDHLSELIEKTLGDLEQSRCANIVEDMNVTALNLGIIASFYYIKYTTIELFNFSLSENTKMKALMDILANASEFDQLAIRHKEDRTLSKLAAHLPVKINKPDYTKTATKVNILLQSHFSRRVLPADLLADQKFVLKTAPSLLQAMVDVISSNGWLTPAISAMELSQMIVQALWDNESTLKQLPHVTKETISRIEKEKSNVETIVDLLELDDDTRLRLLQLEKYQLEEVATAANRYPNIELHADLESKEVKSGTSVKINVLLEREMEEDEKITPVYAPYFPTEKAEGWWLVVGKPDTNQLLAIKRITITKARTQQALEFEAPTAGYHKCFLYFMCDSYMGCDQELEISFTVTDSMEE